MNINPNYRNGTPIPKTKLRAVDEFIKDLCTENADYQDKVQMLEAELTTLREQVRWRKYPDEMPKRDGFYLVLENVNQVAGYYHWCKQFGWNTDGGRINIQTVTHWMPLPQPPEVE